jgi:hypothetical protein
VSRGKTDWASHLIMAVIVSVMVSPLAYVILHDWLWQEVLH